MLAVLRDEFLGYKMGKLRVYKNETCTAVGEDIRSFVWGEASVNWCDYGAGGKNALMGVCGISQSFWRVMQGLVRIYQQLEA
jgi:hypothetical protein